MVPPQAFLEEGMERDVLRTDETPERDHCPYYLQYRTCHMPRRSTARSQ